jgi:hypothetical protein
MPYVIRKDGPESTPWCVYTDRPGGSRHGCHESEDQAKRQQAALYVHAPDAGKGDVILRFGAAVKAMGEGRVGGYLVQFGSEATKDGDGEWFTPETDFDCEFPARASVYYNHCQDPVIGRRRLTHGSMKLDDLGVWVEAQLDLADRYQAAMYAMAAKGKLGWSSGSLSHLTDPPRETPGGAIKSWPLGHDASLTPVPSDSRNMAIALKSWVAEGPAPLEDLMADTLGPGYAIRHASLNETLEQWIEAGEVLAGDCRRHAVKAGRKISNARRERLIRARDLIDEMLAETAPREADAAEESALPPVMGEGLPRLEKPLTASPLPDFDDVFRLITGGAVPA